MTDLPPLRENTVAGLRPYQQEARESVHREWSLGRRWTMAWLATGTGKTILGANIARDIVEGGGRAIVLSHTKELVGNFAAWMDRAGIPTAIEMAGLYAQAMDGYAAVSASVPTMQGDRLETWEPGHFRVAIVDEVHHALAATYVRALKHLQPEYVLGLTATPDRADGQKLSAIFDSVAYRYSMLDAIRAEYPGPYLCRPIYHYVSLPIHLGAMRKRERDYTDDHLQARILPHVGIVANAIRQTHEGRQTIAFLPGVMACQGVASALRSMGVPADWVSGEREDRAGVFEAYTRGDVRVVVNVAVATEGVDLPITGCVVLGRPTTSRLMLIQQIGRGTRRHDASGKKDFLVVDLAMQTGDPLSLMAFASDCFDDGQIDPATLEIARSSVRDRVARGEQGIDLADAIEQAAETVAERAREWRVKAEARDVIGRSVKLDPLAMRDILSLPKAPANAMAMPASAAQVHALEKWGLEGCAGVSKRLAGHMLDKLIERKNKGLASPKQLGALIRNGVPAKEARALSFTEASSRLDGLFGGRR